MKKIFNIIIAIMMITACGENPFMQEWKTPYGLPPFAKIENKHYLPAIKAGIEEQNKEIQEIITNQNEPTFENTIAAYEWSGELLSKTVGVLFNLASSDATPEIQKVVSEALPLLSEHNDNIFMNPDFFERVKFVYEHEYLHENADKDADKSAGVSAGVSADVSAGVDADVFGEELEAERKSLIKKMYDNFVRNGIDLDKEKQDRLREINVRISTLTQKFGDNILAENKKFEDRFGISVSDYEGEMTTNADRKLRKEMFDAYSNRGANHEGAAGETNSDILLEIVKLRTEKANLLGYNNSANFVLSNKMAGNAYTVDEFLDEIMKYAVKTANVEVKELQKFMDKDIEAGLIEKDSKIEPWDWFYYAEKVRKAKYDMDEEQIKPYFKLDNVRKGIFKIAEKLYGVKVTPIKETATDSSDVEISVYHPEVEVFKVSDSEGELLGIFLTDYRPRSTKRGGAWMNNFRDQMVDKTGKDIRPIIVNVGNLGKLDSNVKYPLLNTDEVQTMFHEFGHALHGLLTKCHYPSVSGTSVSRDFVELPSQFNENWAFRHDMLSEYAFHYETGEVIPDSLVAKINQASVFNQGFRTTELCAASILDMKWHELEADTDWDNLDVDKFEEKVCKDMGLPKEIIPRYRSTYFAHIFNGGYNAGYYGYLWAEVLDKDAFEYFIEKDFAPSVATLFKENILERGGSEEPMILYKNFRRRQPDPKALIRARGLMIND